MRKLESDYMGKVAELPCAICGDMPVHVHHLRDGVQIVIYRLDTK